ncbi:MAG: flavodoxin [Crocinitomicaceae bacterium]|nr:flavodoxin [Crocinitomicaceae bacterium]
MNVKIIYGSDTGNTDYVIETYMLNELEIHFNHVAHLNIYNIQENDWDDKALFIIGIPTWYDGELQSDWDTYFEEFKQLNFKGKTFAIFGLGDQIGYGEYFVDGIGILAEVILNNGGNIIGLWPTDQYEFSASKALADANHFYGLAIDEDNEDDQTYDRVKSWVELLYNTCFPGT